MNGHTSHTSTGAALILQALEDAGVTQLFVNLGSDHPAFLSAFASRKDGKLQIYTSPNEMNALSAASGYAQITGRPAAVLVHVECGTQGLAGAVHNVSKGRIPVVILAGTVPVTQEGELVGSRNEYIHWIQDVADQSAIVRQYMKYEHKIQRPHNATQIIYRALQFTDSSPKGPSYVIAARETLEEQVPSLDPASLKLSQTYSKNLAAEEIGLTPSALDILSDALINATHPLIVTSYCGRSVEGFNALKSLAKLLSIPVHENAPIYNNFSTTSFLHQGHQWNGGGQQPALAEADVVLVIDSDVPWITAQSKPRDDTRIFHLDSDPLKEGTTLWYLPCERRWKCDSHVALEQLAQHIQKSASFQSQSTKERIESRTSRLQSVFQSRTERLQKAEESPPTGLTVPFFMSRLRAASEGHQIIGLNESTTNLGNVADHLHHSSPLSLIGSGGGALGWYSGAAVGASLALQEQARHDDLVVAFTGDGTWLFGVPSCAYWMAKKYSTPFLTIIWNNGGWSSPKNACLRLHPEMATAATNGSGKVESLSDRMYVSIDPSPHFGKIAEGAGDAWWAIAREVGDVDGILRDAVKVVKEEKRCAVVEVVINKL